LVLSKLTKAFPASITFKHPARFPLKKTKRDSERTTTNQHFLSRKIAGIGWTMLVEGFVHRELQLNGQRPLYTKERFFSYPNIPINRSLRLQLGIIRKESFRGNNLEKSF
jgi:hypothetical protein